MATSQVPWGDKVTPIGVYIEGGSSAPSTAVTVANGADTVEGALADAAVVTDANGTVSSKLRGLIVLWLAGLKASSAIIGKVGIDQTTPGTTNAVAPIAGQAGVQGASGAVNALTQRVVLATDVGLPAGTAAIGTVAPTGFSFANRAANSTVTHKAGAGVCHGVVVNTVGTTTTIVLYDNTAGSGTKIATIDTSVIGAGLYQYDAIFTTGLTSVTAGVAAADVTVLWR